jgi:alpha-L-rhamnosidase
VSMRLTSYGGYMDAPCRLRLTFGESPLDVTMGMDNVKTWISTSWLPDEIVNIDMCPSTLKLPRRQSFRYLRLEIIDMSDKCKVAFSDVSCECVSAISPTDTLEMIPFKSSMLNQIDHVSLMTLRDCMQTVFEDGPRRDRRLWLGDLRLQALANYKTFKDFKLVKRCIYQFAAIVRDDDSIPACLFEHTTFSPSVDYIVDYDALFAAVVCDYVEASGDSSLGEELWPIVLGCLKQSLSHLDPQTFTFDVSRGGTWKFLDWQPKLDRNAGSHGLLLYCLKTTNKLAQLLGKAPPHEETVSRMTKSAQAFLSADGLFVSGPEAQVSYASAAWLALCGAFSPEEARAALLKTLNHPGAVRPLTPYLWHYVCEALAEVGCMDECLKIMEEYWGKMIEAGADTFWECFDPEDRMSSPYGDVRNNSFCHAWSCTPTYLLRGKLLAAVTDGRPPQIIRMGELDDAWINHTKAALETS